MSLEFLLYLVSVVLKLGIIISVLAIISLCVFCSCLFYTYGVKEKGFEKVLKYSALIFCVSGILFISIPNERQMYMILETYLELKLENVDGILKGMKHK